MNSNTLKKSSILVREFLEKNNLHKKDFAKIIGVTLSYVYNLIDENIPFSTRSTTLERIATVMDINPEEFIEYRIPDDLTGYDENILLVKDLIKANNLTTLEFIKKFDNKKKLEVVDILRGASPLWIDFDELKKLAGILNMNKEDLFKLWREEFIKYLKKGKFNIEKNEKILNGMLQGAYKTI